MIDRIETKCDFCKGPASGFRDTSYGIANGETFVSTICPKCRKVLSNEQIREIGQNKIRGLSVGNKVDHFAE